MNTLFLKLIRRSALFLAVAVLVGYGLNAARPATTAMPQSSHTLLADGGQETHGKGHLIRIRHLA